MMRKAQSVLEYAIVITCLVVALLAMRTYITRGMQGHLREEIDQIGQQYDPGNTTSTTTITTNSLVTTDTSTINDGNVTRTNTTSTTDYDITTRSGSERIE
jgi:hypothetical protein